MPVYRRVPLGTPFMGKPGFAENLVDWISQERHSIESGTRLILKAVIAGPRIPDAFHVREVLHQEDIAAIRDECLKRILRAVGGHFLE